MATSGYGITQGLAVDLSRPLQYAMERDIKSQVAAQKAQEQQRKELDKLTSKLYVNSAKIGIPQNQQIAKEVIGGYLKRVSDGYKQDKNYINSVDMNVDFNKTMADLIMLGQSDAVLIKDKSFSMENGDKFQFDPVLADILQKGDMAGYKQYFINKGLNPGQYSPGMAISEKHDEQDFLKSVLEKMPTTQKAKYLGTKGNAYAYELTDMYDDAEIKKKVGEYMQSHPATAHHFGGDIDKAAAYIPKTKASKIQLSNIAPKSKGSTFNFGGYGGNKNWGVTQNANKELEIVSTGNVQNNLGTVVADGVPYRFTYAKISPDRTKVTLMLPPEKLKLNATKSGFDLLDVAGNVTGTITVANNQTIKTLFEKYTGQKYSPQLKLDAFEVPARPVEFNFDDVKNQLEINTGLDLKDAKPAKTTTPATTKESKPSTSATIDLSDIPGAAIRK